jgi:hypothetical protein
MSAKGQEETSTGFLVRPHNRSVKPASMSKGCPDRRIDRLCITCCSPFQPSHHATILGAIPLDLQRGRIIVPLARSHHGPGHSGKLVGKRDGGDFGWPSCQQRREPGPMLGAMELGITDDGECAGHEQAAQIAVALFTDTAELVPTPARVLFRYQPDPPRSCDLSGKLWDRRRLRQARWRAADQRLECN